MTTTRESERPLDVTPAGNSHSDVGVSAGAAPLLADEIHAAFLGLGLLVAALVINVMVGGA